MRTTVTIDDELLTQAQRLTGIEERSALLRAGLEALVQREAASRLRRLGGTMAAGDIAPAPRRRTPKAGK